MKRLFVFAAGAGLLGIVLAGCGTPKPAATQTQQTQSPTPTTTSDYSADAPGMISTMSKDIVFAPPSYRDGNYANAVSTTTIVPDGKGPTYTTSTSTGGSSNADGSVVTVTLPPITNSAIKYDYRVDYRVPYNVVAYNAPTNSSKYYAPSFTSTNNLPVFHGATSSNVYQPTQVFHQNYPAPVNSNIYSTGSFIRNYPCPAYVVAFRGGYMLAPGCY